MSKILQRNIAWYKINCVNKRRGYAALPDVVTLSHLMISVLFCFAAEIIP